MAAVMLSRACLWALAVALSAVTAAPLQPWGPEGMDVNAIVDVPLEFTSGEAFRSFDLQEVHRRYVAETGLKVLVQLWEVVPAQALSGLFPCVPWHSAQQDC